MVTSGSDFALTDKALWQKIRTALLPAGPETTFAMRLAVTEGLSNDEAEAIVEEYRRFLYLATVADSPRASAELVGLAWQLHAAHGDYLAQFCPEVLGKALPYIPGIENRSDHLAPQYGRALDEVDRDIAYRRARLEYAVEFGESPEELFWPKGSDRSPDILAVLAMVGILALSCLLSLLWSDPRLLAAGAGAGIIIFILLAYRTRDSRGWRREALDFIRVGF